MAFNAAFLACVSAAASAREAVRARWPSYVGNLGHDAVFLINQIYQQYKGVGLAVVADIVQVFDDLDIECAITGDAELLSTLKALPFIRAR